MIHTAPERGHPGAWYSGYLTALKRGRVIFHSYPNDVRSLLAELDQAFERNQRDIRLLGNSQTPTDQAIQAADDYRASEHTIIGIAWRLRNALNGGKNSPCNH
jgi:hypothetical protein